jgi:CheY-like chemotaxis protein
MKATAVHPSAAAPRTGQGLEQAPWLGGNRSQLLTGYEPELSGARAHLLRPLIVHVDDEPDVRELIRLILTQIGNYRLESFGSGTETLAFCRQTRPALLITDILRADMNGLALCREIRSDAALYDLPILVLSAAIGYTDTLHALGAAYLSKACDMVELLSAVDDLLRSAAPVQPVR